MKIGLQPRVAMFNLRKDTKAFWSDVQDISDLVMTFIEDRYDSIQIEHPAQRDILRSVLHQQIKEKVEALDLTSMVQHLKELKEELGIVPEGKNWEPYDL